MSSSYLNIKLNRREAIATIASGAAIAGGLILPSGKNAFAAPIEPTKGTAQSPTRYFPESGHNLKGPFLTQWTKSGGREVLGIPLSEDRFAEGVGVVQTFQTITLMYDPALSEPWTLQAQHLPSEFRTSSAPGSARKGVTGCSAGATTGDTVRAAAGILRSLITPFSFVAPPRPNGRMRSPDSRGRATSAAVSSSAT